MGDKQQPSRDEVKQRIAAMQHGSFARSWQDRSSSGGEPLQGQYIERGDSISSSHSRSATDIARQIGLATVDSPQAPLSGPLSGPLSNRSSHSSQSMPQAPLSAPHTLSPTSNHAAPRSPGGADWRTLVEGPDSGLRAAMRSSVSSLGSQHSVASFDPSTVSGERSNDSLGSFTRARQDSQGSNASGDSLRASTGGDGRRWASGRGGEDRERIREELPLELRSYGAPAEYADMPRHGSGGSSQAGSMAGRLSAENLRRSEVGQATTQLTYELSGGPSLERGSLRDTLDEAPLPEFWNTGKAAGGSGAGLESPVHSSRGSMISVSADPSQEAPSGDDTDSQRKAGLSDAVIRKLKLKNSQLEKELREKKKQVEEMTKSVVSWKKAVKEKHVSKVEQVEGLLNQRLHRSYNLSRKLRVKLVSGVCKRHTSLSAMAAFSHWYQQVETSKLVTKVEEVKGRQDASERMVKFLKDQLYSAGLVPRELPEGLRSDDLVKINAVLESMLVQTAQLRRARAQIPSGTIGVYDIEAAVSKAASGEGSVMSKLEMLWAEVRELVGSSTKDSMKQEGAISSELAIARLRGKVDHLSQMLKAREEDTLQLRNQLELQAKQEASSERVDELNKEVARANVTVKELERSLAEAQGARAEVMTQLKQQSARMNSLSADLQSKEAESAVLSALQQQITQLHAMARELDADDVPPKGGDAFGTLKALGKACEQLSNSKAQLAAQKQDLAKKLAVTQKELAEALEREGQLSVAEGRIRELQGEAERLREREREVAGELEVVREEKATLQAQAGQMLRDAERVSNLARERAVAVSDKTREVEDLQRTVTELTAKKEEEERAAARSAEEVQELRTQTAALRKETEEAQRRAEAAEVELAEAVGAGKAAEQAAKEEEQQLAAMEAKMKALQEDNLRMASQVRANSVALRERDAAEVRAQIEQQSLQQLQAEMGKTAAALAKVKEEGEAKNQRIAALEQQAKGREMEMQRKELELERLRQELMGSRSMSKASTEGGGESWGERARKEEGRARGDEASDARSEALLPHAAVALDLVPMLKDLLACKGDEVLLLRERLRAKTLPRDPAGALRDPAAAGDPVRAAGGGGGGGLDGVGAEGSFSGAGGQPLSVEEWRQLLAGGNLSTAFGSFGIKRPLFTSVRKTYFAPRS